MQYLLALTLLLAPTYAVRFSLFGLPTNLLMLWIVFVWIYFIVYLMRYKKVEEFFNFVEKIDKKIFYLVWLFFLSGLIALFIYGFTKDKVGQFVVLFIQPISLFFIGGYIFGVFPKSKNLLLTISYLLLAVMGIYSIIQYQTLFGLPPKWWGNSIEPKRALGFFGHPNFYALFSAPLLAFLLADVMHSVKDKGLKIKDLRFWAWGLGVIGLLLSLSRAGWLGLFAALMFYTLVAANKKVRRLILGGLIIIVMAIVITPNWRYRFITPFHGEWSTNSRLSLWQTGWMGVKKSPLLGLGLNGFAKNWYKLNANPALLEPHNFPHNIFLNFWVETGLLGLVSFVILVGLIIYRGLQNSSQSQEGNSSYQLSISSNKFALPVSLFLIALVVQGLVDNPYFKNDLAVTFWLMLATGI